MCSQHPPLGEGRDPVHAGQQRADVLAGLPGGGLIARLMLVAQAGNTGVAGPPVGDHGGAGFHVVADETTQRGRGSILNDLHPTAAESAGGLFNSHRHHRFLPLRAAARQPWLDATEVGLIDLHRARQPLPARTDQHLPQPVQHRPLGGVRTDLQRPLHRQRGDTILGRNEHPARLEPHRQRRAPPVEQRPRRHRGPPTAAPAPVPAVRYPPAARAPAMRADEPRRPSDPVEVIEAVLICSEPRPQLARRPGVMHTCAQAINHTPKTTPLR